MNIVELTKNEILQLRPSDIKTILLAEEIVHMAKTLDSYWAYDYVAAEDGRPGEHALLKSGLHSDGFFISRIFLEYDNIRRIIADQLVRHVYILGVPEPDFVVGIPDGATKLGEDVAAIMGVRLAQMQKVDGKIIFTSDIPSGSSLLLAEDFCTKGTGFHEAVLDIVESNSAIDILLYELLIINRGNLKEIVVPGVGAFKIIAAAEYKVNNWDEDSCQLCLNYNSKPIKPKATDANWEEINNSQK